MALVLALSVAFAGGFYHPADIAGASTQYARASEAAGSSFEERNQKIGALSRALRDYELALDLLGERSPADERTRYEEQLVAFNRQRAKIEAFANTMIEDFDGQFQEAVARALKGREAEVCEAEIPAGRALPGMPVRTKPNPACKGDNLNASIAQAIDADAELKRNLDEILGLAWPDITLDSTAQPPALGEGAYVDVTTFFGKAAGSKLRDIDKRDDLARSPIHLALDEGVSASELESLKAEAAGITEQTRAARAAIGEPVLAAARAAVTKWQKKGGAPFAWCANPKALGGCTGDDGTAELVGKLLADKKISKALE